MIPAESQPAEREDRAVEPAPCLRNGPGTSPQESLDSVTRRERIRSQIVAAGSARVDDLAATFGVSAMTVHRDLDVLAARGWLTKVRGGAQASAIGMRELDVDTRRLSAQPEKAAIARTALRAVGPGQTIFLDDSTSALALCPGLSEIASITVVTNFLPIVASLRGSPNVSLHLLGGHYDSIRDGFYGAMTQAAIASIRADVALLSPAAVDRDTCLHRGEPELLVARAMMDAARRNVLLIDHTKLQANAALALCDLAEFDIVITDADAEDDDVSRLAQHCRALQVAAPS